jgi:hypothetical protein
MRAPEIVIGCTIMISARALEHRDEVGPSPALLDFVAVRALRSQG